MYRALARFAQRWQGNLHYGGVDYGSRMRRPILACALAIAAALPATAHATLVYSKNPNHSSVWVANDDGSNARRLASGSAPKISPDGLTVAYMVIGNEKTYRPDLMVVPADGSAPPRLLAKGWRDSFSFAWAPNSQTIATILGPELGAKRLALVDVAAGTQRTIARGAFAGLSFSPAGDQLVYGRDTEPDRFPPHSDVYRAAVAGGAPIRLTRDHRSLSPLWGPTGKVVFVRLVDAKRRRYAPKNELYLIGADGSGLRRLTRTSVGQLLQGLTPTAWSADGTRLLAEFGGQDTSYAETVNPATGAHRPVVRPGENGFVGTDLSADGSTILGATGGYEPSTKHDVVAIPYGGGTPTVLARNALEPDWNR
jgi:Tol biopolymer transport system component